MLVEVQRRLGQYDDAAQVTDVALTRFPDSADLHYARGQLRLRAMDYAEAEASLRRAIELDPSHREAHETLATVLLRTDRAGEARREQAVASRLMDYEAGKRNMEPHLASSRDPAVPMLLAELELTERHYDDAIRWFSRAIALGGASARPVVGRAEALYSSGDVEGGDADLARLGDLSHPRIELARAARAVATGDADAARTYLATAVRGTLDEREFLRRAADLYDRIGDGARADALLQRAAEAPRTSSGPEDE